MRVFDPAYSPNSFNPGRGGAMVRGRFHFFQGPAGAVVPVLYGSDQEDAAIAETLFHDVPVRNVSRVVPEQRVASYSLVTLVPRRMLLLVQLLGFGLRRLGLRAENLTDTPPTAYPETVDWARALHAALPEVHGLVWMSRQFNSAMALVLFGDRVTAADFEVGGPIVPLSVGAGRERLDSAANRAGILIVG